MTTTVSMGSSKPHRDPSSDPRRADTPSALPRRVLVVDDNVDAAELLSAALEMVGYTSQYATSGTEALEIAETYQPSVALLDIGLPDMDGYELARHLQERLPKIRLIALTGYGQASDRSRTRAAGLQAHLVKPVEIEKLHQTIDEVMSAAH